MNTPTPREAALWKFVFPLILRNLRICESAEAMTTWTVTGAGAFIGLLLGKIESITRVIPLPAVKTALIYLAISVVLGSLSKLLGAACKAGLDTSSEMIDRISKPEAINDLRLYRFEPSEITEKMAGIYPKLFAKLVRWIARNAPADLYKPARMLAWFLTIQIVTNVFHILAIASAIAVLVTSTAP